VVDRDWSDVELYIMSTIGWVLFLDQVYPYHLRELLTSAHLFNQQLSSYDYELLDDYFGSEAQIHSRPSASFLEVWPKFLRLLVERADDVRRDLVPELSPSIVDDVWIPAVRNMIDSAEKNRYIVWTSLALVVDGKPFSNQPVKPLVLMRKVESNLTGSLRERASMLLNFGDDVPDYIDGFIKTYNVVACVMNDQPAFLNFDPRKSIYTKPEYFCSLMKDKTRFPV